MLLEQAVMGSNPKTLSSQWNSTVQIDLVQVAEP